MNTKKIRYEKFSKITVDGKSYTLIEYIGILRKKHGVKKTDISRIIKNNNSWYSQVEMGQKDDMRIKYIGRDELIDIISIIKFSAKNNTELQIYQKISSDFLDNEIKATPLDIIPRQIPVYEMLQYRETIETPAFSEGAINYAINGFIESIQTIYDAMNDSYQKLALSQIINQMKQNLLLHPASALLFYGLPFCDFFQHPNIPETEQDILAVELTKDLTDLFNKYSHLMPSENSELIINSIKKAISNHEMLQKGMGSIIDFED